MTEKLNGKDLINVGIFSAIYFVIVFITAMLGMVPILYPMLTVICPLVGGVVYMLFLTRVKKFGMIWIMSILMGILMLLSGMSWYALAIGVFSVLIAALIFKSGNYAGAVKGVVSHAVFSLWIFGNYLIFYLNHETYMETREEMIGKEYVDKLNSILPMWSWVILLAATLIFELIGGLIGNVMLKKHLSKAGIT